MNTNPLLTIIEDVLERSAEKQINLKAPAARREIAQRIIGSMLGKYHFVAYTNESNLND